MNGLGIYKIMALIVKYIVLIISFFFSGLKVKQNMVCYISYKYEKVSIDMKRISKALKREMGDKEIQEIYLFLKYKNTIKGMSEYFFNILKQIYYVSIARVVIIDTNNIVISSIRKKEKTKVIQIWHATGAIKRFGQDIDRIYKIKNYDYVLTSSTTQKKYFKSAFNIEEEKILPLGVAKTDILFSKKKLSEYKKEMLEKRSYLKGKKVMLYAPTFRGTGVFDIKYIDINLKKINEMLGEEWIILYKHHPIRQGNTNIEFNEKVYDCYDESLYKLFSVADVLVSDYSAIIYDFLILEKPIILYCPDLDEYKKERGLYIDYYNEIPGKIALTEKDISKIIKENNFDMEWVKSYKRIFYDFLDGQSSKRIGKFIAGIIQ